MLVQTGGKKGPKVRGPHGHNKVNVGLAGVVHCPCDDSVIWSP